MSLRLPQALLAGYLVLLHMFAAVLVIKTDFLPRLSAKLENPAPRPDPHIAKMLQHQRWMDDAVPDGAVIFLGDSITQGLATAAVAPISINYGIGTSTTADLIGALPSYKSLEHAGSVVLAIGINNLARGMRGDLANRYQQIVATLPSAVPLVWSSLLPVRPSVVAANDIAAANRSIQSLCAARAHCTFIDMLPLLADDNGTPHPDHYLEDGLHLSPSGYRIWIETLKQAIRSSPG